MHKRWLAAYVGMASLALLAACASPSPQSSRPISKIEARSLPAKQVVQRATSQLAEILSLVPYPPSTVRPVIALKDLWFWTTPRATAVPGLCRSDEVVIEFAPSIDISSELNSDTQTRATGIRATPRFRFLAPPAPTDWPDFTADEKARANADCALVDPQKEAFFETDSEFEGDANRMALLFERMQAELASGASGIDLVCSNSTKPCAEMFATMTLEDLRESRRCRGDDGKLATCTEFRTRNQTSGDSRIYVFWKYSDIPETIYRVEVHELVVLGHARID